MNGKVAAVAELASHSSHRFSPLTRVDQARNDAASAFQLEKSCRSTGQGEQSSSQWPRARRQRRPIDQARSLRPSTHLPHLS
jgi:hypothetical protein